jgi:hypothetical protein
VTVYTVYTVFPLGLNSNRVGHGVHSLEAACGSNVKSRIGYTLAMRGNNLLLQAYLLLRVAMCTWIVTVYAQ